MLMVNWKSGDGYNFSIPFEYITKYSMSISGYKSIQEFRLYYPAKYRKLFINLLPKDYRIFYYDDYAGYDRVHKVRVRMVTFSAGDFEKQYLEVKKIYDYNKSLQGLLE